MDKKKWKQDKFFSAFTTAWGPVGVIANQAGITRVILPAYQMDDLLGLLQWEHPNAKRCDEIFTDFIEQARSFFNAKPADFSDIALDLPSEDTFYGTIYRAARKIEYGQTVSYLELAKKISKPESVRALATGLGKNPTPLIVPCHRIIYSSGKIGGFSAAGGVPLKQRMIDLEKSK